MRQKITRAVLVAAAMAAGGTVSGAILQSTQVAAGLNSPVFVTGAPGIPRISILLRRVQERRPH